MLTVTLLRHGKTSGNLRGAFVGGIDQPLSDEGRAELAALPPLQCFAEPQSLFASPMRRCVQTAEILFPEYEPVIVEGLRERNFGDFEGKTHDDIIALPGYEGWGMNAASMEFPGGEARDAFYTRCVGAFRETVDWCVGEGIENAAMVIHGGVIMALMAQLCLPARDYFDWHCPNGGGYIVEWDGDHMTMKERLGC